jgi:NAD(P)H-hydrate repair Nnr-like enzyme with NAD(P)H-hydrate dehydratase domain
MFPKIIYGVPFVEQVAALPRRPKLIADAGGMYLMKTVGKATAFDVFTPDEGELYFLADETAPHPLYVRREILEGEHSVENLYWQAHAARNTALLTVIKGSTDRVFENGRKVFELSAPLIPAMEAIGGTGDTVTGLLTAFMAAGDARGVEKALTLNRLIGQAVRCTPATQIVEFIDAIPGVLEKYDQTTS